MRKSLQAVKGVKNVEVSLPRKEAVVIFDDQQSDANALIKAIRDAGFRSTIKSGS